MPWWEPNYKALGNKIDRRGLELDSDVIDESKTKNTSNTGNATGLFQNILYPVGYLVLEIMKQLCLYLSTDIAKDLMLTNHGIISQGIKRIVILADLAICIHTT